MITYTSNNCNKWGLVSNDGPKVIYETKPQISKAWSLAIGLLVFVLITLAVLALFS